MANAYDDDGDYDDYNERAALAGDKAAENEPPEQVGIGHEQPGGKLYSDDASADPETQTNDATPAQPPPPSWCEKCFNWFPIRSLCFLGGLVLIACCCLDFAFNGSDSFIQWILRLYLIFFGAIMAIVESPTWRFTRGIQLRVFFWFRILSRMWGRAWFYLFISILCFAEFSRENWGEFTVTAGFYLFCVCTIFSFIFSRFGATKLNRMYAFVASGAEGEALKTQLESKFDELAAVTHDLRLGSQEIAKLAKDAGRELSNGERHVIQTYLDESCNGYVNKEDFVKQFMKLNTEKQRFL